MKYYRITWDEDAEGGMAHSPDSLDVIVGREQKSVPFRILEGKLIDYQPNLLGWPLCSERLRKILDEGKSARDEVTWTPIEVSYRGRDVVYFRFQSVARPEVLHPDSLVVNTMLVKPVLDQDRVRPYRVFTLDEYGVCPCISEQVKYGMDLNHISGLVYMPVPTRLLH